MTDAIALVIGLLCAHGLWKPARRARETGYKIHDFLDYNQKRADVEKARDDKSRAGKRGASVRWAKDSSAENGSRHRDSRHHGNRQASANGREMPPSRPASTTPPSPSSGFTAAMLNDCDDGQAGFCVRTEFLATVPPDLRRQCPAHTTPPEEVKPAW